MIMIKKKKIIKMIEKIQIIEIRCNNKKMILIIKKK